MALTETSHFSYMYDKSWISFYPDFHIKIHPAIFLTSELTKKRRDNFNIIFKILKVKTNPYLWLSRFCLKLEGGKAHIL